MMWWFTKKVHKSFDAPPTRGGQVTQPSLLESRLDSGTHFQQQNMLEHDPQNEVIKGRTTSSFLCSWITSLLFFLVPFVEKPAAMSQQYSSRPMERTKNLRVTRPLANSQVRAPPQKWVLQHQSSLHMTPAPRNILVVRSGETLMQYHLAQLLQHF